ncbi:MAG: hypothetical protein DI586_00625 [Micavibrio aeruginosavorus]|uniref:Type IV secretion protein DotG n=1 Tax=Micavibrio aeruginosavorus TaxID=349221 RepID=A0A2W5HUK9_9BACT|nr:MAG: hypothetical protein DI586_00625 [Micavibrio aeruginosavorus]
MNNKDDLDDFDNNTDTDLDTDFGEFDQETEKGSLSELIKKNPAVKIGLVVAGLLVIVGAITLFGGSDTAAPNSNVSAGNDLKQAPGTADLSPEMKQVIEEVNQTGLEESQKQGTSFMPQPIETGKEQLQLPAEEATAEDPLLKWRQIQDERLKAEQAQVSQEVQDPAKQQAVTNLVNQMNAQMAQILSGKKIDSLKSMQVTSLKDLMDARQKLMEQNGQVSGQLTNSASNADPNNPANNPALQTPVKILLPAGAIEYGQLLIEANSDIPGPIVAMIVSGPFSGSRVLGSFQRSQEYLVLQFRTLINKKGVSIPVDAYALDPDTTLTGMATDVDNRYWKRIILPAAADFIEGVAEAYSEQQGTTTIVTGDVVVQDEPTIDYQEQLASGLEKASERAGEILEQEGNNTPPLVRVRAGTPMGILFMSPITDQDLNIGSNNPETARMRLEQQQESLLQQQLQQTNQPQSPLYLIQGLQNGQNTQGTSSYTGTQNSNAYGSPNTNGRSSSIFSTQDYINNR